ncbi:MAG: hypothetical protein AB1540_14700 [Bdellovibrionota bacterium]
MMVNVVKELVARHSKAELEKAASLFESRRENLLGVEGKDDGEKLSNLLAAIEIRSQVDQGASVNDALRAFSQRIRSVLKPAVKQKSSG